MRLGEALERRRAILRAGFWLYAVAVFTATHWPALEIRVARVERPDLIIHLVCFGAWFGLLWLSGYAGAPLVWRSVVLAGIVACGYAAADEGLQAIPWMRRTCAWDDYLANCAGIGLGALGASAVVLVMQRKGVA